MKIKSTQTFGSRMNTVCVCVSVSECMFMCEFVGVNVGLFDI